MLPWMYYSLKLRCSQELFCNCKRIQPPAAQGTARHPETLLERGTVVAVLLRLKLWWSADFHRAPVHRTAADSTLKSKDGYAVRAILPRPERRGLSRTGSGTPSAGLRCMPSGTPSRWSAHQSSISHDPSPAGFRHLPLLRAPMTRNPHPVRRGQFCMQVPAGSMACAPGRLFLRASGCRSSIRRDRLGVA